MRFDGLLTHPFMTLLPDKKCQTSSFDKIIAVGYENVFMKIENISSENEMKTALKNDFTQLCTECTQ